MTAYLLIDYMFV